jgi:hypothetical protein
MLNFLQDTFIISAIQARDSGEGLYQQRSLVIIVALMHVPAVVSLTSCRQVSIKCEHAQQREARLAHKGRPTAACAAAAAQGARGQRDGQMNVTIAYIRLFFCSKKWGGE